MEKIKVKAKTFHIAKIMFFIIALSSILALICISAYFSLAYPLYYRQEINMFSSKYHIDNALVASMINAESGFNKDSVSHKGALGLMQIMPSTAKWIAKEIGYNTFEVDELFDPGINIEFGCFYLNYLLGKFEDRETALCAYNAGETVVKSWLNNQKYSVDKIKLNIIPYTQTERYIEKINKNYDYYSKKL